MAIRIDSYSSLQNLNFTVYGFQIITIESFSTIFIYLEYIEGPVAIRSCLIVIICTGFLFIAIGSSCCSKCSITCCRNTIDTRSISIRAGNIIEIITFVEVIAEFRFINSSLQLLRHNKIT